MGYKGRHTAERQALPAPTAYTMGQAAIPWVRSLDELEDTVPMADPWGDYELSWPYTPMRLEASA
jgi:hypothetical protein